MRIVFILLRFQSRLNDGSIILIINIRGEVFLRSDSHGKVADLSSVYTGYTTSVMFLF